MTNGNLPTGKLLAEWGRVKRLSVRSVSRSGIGTRGQLKISLARRLSSFNQNGHGRIQTARTIDALRGLLKVFRFRLGNVNELLRVAVNQGEPRTLNLNHHAVSAPECVIDIRHLETDRG